MYQMIQPSCLNHISGGPTVCVCKPNKQSTANQDQDNEIPGYSERHRPVTNIWANPPNQSQQDKSKYKTAMLIDYQLNIESCQTKWKYLKLVVLRIVVWQFPSCVIPARKAPSLNPSFFGNDQLVHIHTRTDFYTPVILHKPVSRHICYICVKGKTYILLCQKKRASQMGRRGNGLWNSCHRPLVSAETLLLTTTRWQHLKFLNLPKILGFFLSNCLNWKTDGIMSNPTEKFVDAEDRVSLAQQKSAARCQQNGFIVGNTNALAANCIFAKMEKYLSNIDKIFSHHPKSVFLPNSCFFLP